MSEKDERLPKGVDPARRGLSHAAKGFIVLVLFVLFILLTLAVWLTSFGIPAKLVAQAALVLILAIPIIWLVESEDGREHGS